MRTACYMLLDNRSVHHSGHHKSDKGGFQVSGLEIFPCIGGTQYWSGAHRFTRQSSHPAEPNGRLKTRAPGWLLLFSQVRGTLRISGGDRLADHTGKHIILPEPLARSQEQYRCLIRLLSFQARLQGISKQVVTAALNANIIQRNMEQVAAFQRCQHSLAVFFPGESSVLNAAQRVEY